jgi:hypothetical protein
VLPTAWKQLSAETRGLLVHTHGIKAGADAAARLREVLEDERLALAGPGSRQAKHARLQRLLTGALTSPALAALDDSDAGRLFQRADFAALRPNSADTHVRFGAALQGLSLDTRVVDACWAKQAEQFLALARRSQQLDAAGLAVLHASLIPLFAGSIARGPALRDAWRELWRELERAGALGNPGLHAHLAGMGSFVGESGPSLQMCKHPALVRADICSALCLARSDNSPELNRAISANLRGDPIEPEACLHSARPASTIASLAGYIRGLMRQPSHFYTEGLILSVLRWTGYIGTSVNLRQDDWSTDIARLLRELRHIEQVQILEKSRFWKVIEGASDPETRALLVQLWSRAGTGQTDADDRVGARRR